jgi:hypothetical protein
MSKSRGLFHITVATMKGARDGFAGLGESTDMLIHKTAAISYLRSSISSSTAVIDDAMILTMLLLALLEDALGNRNAYQIHRAQVARLTNRRCAEKGAVNNEHFQAIVRQYCRSPSIPDDCFADTDRFETWNCPQNFMKYQQSYDKAYQLNPPQCIISQFPIGFRDLANQGRLSSQTVRVIQRVAGQQNFGVWPSSFDAKDSLIHGDPWTEPAYNDFREALPALNIADGPGGPPLEKLISLALIRYCLNRAVYERPRACIYHMLSIELLDVLARLSPTSDISSERQALIWVYAMAIDCWTVASREISAEATHLIELMETKFPETRDWSGKKFDAFGQRFLWTKNISSVMAQYHEKRVYEPNATFFV